MDHRFEKMEALLNSIQGKLESNNKVAKTKMETLSTTVRALQKCSSSQQSSIQIYRKTFWTNLKTQMMGKIVTVNPPQIK
eukprot:5271672-Ditylum_brightwellii.AAC.1